MSPDPLTAPTLQEIRDASTLLAPHIVRTPLLRLDSGRSPKKIFLKLENLQHNGSFKIRPLGNMLMNRDVASLRHGIYTVSSGNSGAGVAWMARELGVAATVYAPNDAPANKVEVMREFGAQIQVLPPADWWECVEQGGHPTDPGLYVDAVRNPAAMAGNGTIGLEIVEQLPDVDTVFIPFGGGGLACGIASAIRALKPDTRIIVAESDAATPLGAALEAGKPVPVEFRPSFISGAGAPAVLPEMWPLIRELVDAAVVSSLADVADAMRLIFEANHVVAEGAGATALAAALQAKDDTGRTVCIVSGGNIGPELMCRVLQGDVP